MSKKVLVTGHTGIIGRRLFERLSVSGYEVEGVSREQNPAGVLDRDFIHSRIEGRELVFHLAANVYIWAAQTRPELDCEANVLGSLNVMEGCAKYGAKLILPSTIHVYAIPEKEGTALTESSRIEPPEFYGVSKLAVENYARVFNKQAKLKAVTLRLPWVYGKDLRKRRGLIADLASAKSEPIRLHHAFCDIFDYVHVDDVSTAMILAAESPVDFGIFNIGSGTAVTCRQVVDLFGRSAIENPSHRNHRAVLDSSLAHQALGWRPDHNFLDDFSTLLPIWCSGATIMESEM